MLLVLFIYYEGPSFVYVFARTLVLEYLFEYSNIISYDLTHVF